MDTALKTAVSDAGFAENIRAQFPILGEQVNGRPLVYFDSAATTQKPQVVIDAVNEYYAQYNSNVHRGVHHLSQKATTAMEKVRENIANFIGADRHEEIIFTSGTTSAINLVSHALAHHSLRPGDEILITEMEHHSNIVPWQLACEYSGALLKVTRVQDDGSLDLEHFRSLLNSRTKVVSLVHISNALGTINPVKELVAEAKKAGALTLIDGAQAVAHIEIDVQDLGCDFYVFSAHKLYGPTGIGVLFGRYDLLDSLPPYQGGGEMIDRVTFAHTTYNALPFKYEAGTPNIAGIIGLGAAINWLQKTGLKKIAGHEQQLLQYATEQLNELEGFIAVGTASEKANIISFNLEGIHAYDLGVLLDQMGIALRTGHHCTQPLMDRFEIAGTARVSIAVYNNRSEIDALMGAILKAQSMLK